MWLQAGDPDVGSDSLDEIKRKAVETLWVPVQVKDHDEISMPFYGLVHRWTSVSGVQDLAVSRALLHPACCFFWVTRLNMIVFTPSAQVPTAAQMPQ